MVEVRWNSGGIVVEKMVEQAAEQAQAIEQGWISIKIRPTLYDKIKKVADEKGCSMSEAINSLEKVILKNFPHQNATDLIKCDECRPHVIEAIKKVGYWPKEKIKEVIKIVEVPAGKIEIDKGPIKHLGYEIKPKHLV